jgi:hypothetical protein
MANNKKTANTPSSSTPHPGSSIEDARAVGGKGDFGVPESNVIGRTYTSTNTKRSDPGNAPARGGADDSRTTGVGGNASGVGSSSGGDLDTDIIGVGTDGSGIAASGKVHEPSGPDDAQATSHRTVAQGRQGAYQSPEAGVIHGSTVQRADDQTAGPAGADAASNTHSDDDSFAGEVSTDEATG